MRKLMIFVAAIAMQCFIAGPGHAAQVQVKLTSDQVKTTCGSKIIYTTSDGYGCKVSCGDGKTCGFSCDKNGKNCKGHVNQARTAPSSKPEVMKQPEILGNSSGFGGNTPGAAGRPSAPSAAPAGRLY